MYNKQPLRLDLTRGSKVDKTRHLPNLTDATITGKIGHTADAPLKYY